jgi:hypothetical protein
VIRELPCSGALKAVLRQATAWEPGGRYAAMTTLCGALRDPPPETVIAGFPDEKVPSLRAVAGKYQGSEFALPPGKTISIGRASDADIVLVEESVSRRHALITIGKELILEDLGTTNGTFVNGEKITKTAISSGDRLLIGTSIMVFVAVDAVAPHPSPIQT